MIYDKMNDCFDSLTKKVFQTINESDLNVLFKQLAAFNDPTIICGVGGSLTVAGFMAKVLREKNHIISHYCSPRDLLYMDISAFQNIVSVSYSANNPGVDIISNLNKSNYLFTGNPRTDFNNLIYHMPAETSYVSISACIVPMALLFLYYCKDQKLLEEILDYDISSDSNNTQYEILSGYDTATASLLTESSITESGIGTCIVHDKYNYCHGRINITRNSHSDLIFFYSHNELDDMLLKQLQNHYQKIIIIERKYDDDIINDFYSSCISLKLIRCIAENKNIDISNMKEFEDNDVFYLFKGKMK